MSVTHTTVTKYDIPEYTEYCFEYKGEIWIRNKSKFDRVHFYRAKTGDTRSQYSEIGQKLEKHYQRIRKLERICK